MKKSFDPIPPEERPGYRPPPSPMPPPNKYCKSHDRPPPPPGPPCRIYKEMFFCLFETKESKLATIKYEAFMDGYNFALQRSVQDNIPKWKPQDYAVSVRKS